MNDFVGYPGVREVILRDYCEEGRGKSNFDGLS